MDTWQQMAGRLEPVIGARGVEALFGRALHVSSKTFPWLTVSGAKGNSAESLANVKACFEGRETSAATDAGNALLVTFAELLAGLIGESLTERLLGVVWVPCPPESEHEASP